LCRYGGRPAFAGERLALTAGGQVSYRLKKPWPDGRTHLELSPVAFLRRLAGILPPPRRHLVRYAGVFASRARRRAGVVALAPANRADAVDIAAGQSTESTAPAAPVPNPPGRRVKARLPWAELLQRVFAKDVLACPCGGRRRVLAFITDLHVARDILAALGLPATIPTFATARAPPNLDDWLGHASDVDLGDVIDDPSVDPESDPPAGSDDLGDWIGDTAPDDFADPPAWDESDNS